MNKDDLEGAMRNAGLTPVGRKMIDGYNVLLADGFCANPEQAFKRFGVEQGEYENGCYVSAWLWSKDDDIAFGRPIFFDVLHDIETMDLRTRRDARINTAIEDARKHIQLLKKHDGHGFTI